MRPPTPPPTDRHAAQTGTYNSVVGNLAPLSRVGAGGTGAERGPRVSRSATDRTVRGGVPSNNRVQRGNPDLKNETSINTDVAVRVQTGRRTSSWWVRQPHRQLHLFQAHRDLRLAIGRFRASCSDPDNFSSLPEFPVGTGERATHGYRVLGRISPDDLPAPQRDSGTTPRQNRSTDQPLRWFRGSGRATRPL